MIGFFEIVIIWTVIALAIYFYNASRRSFWEKRNVGGPKPVPIFGNLMDVIFGRTSVHEMYRDLYLTWKHEPFFGLYQGTTPVLVINDPGLIKDVLIKDFTAFTDRGFIINEKADPLSANLFLLEGHRWKGLRAKLSPVFTSGKLKQMYHLLTESAGKFENFINEVLTKSNTIDVKEASANYTMDVIGSCLFGLNLNTLSTEDNEFRKIGQRIVSPTITCVFKHWLRDLSPTFYKLFNINIVSQKDTDFFTGSITETISYRKKNGIVRHDFIYFLTQLQENQDGIDFEITEELLVAQAFIFFMAGFDSSSTTMSLALYEIAQNKEIQGKLRAEIHDALKKHDGFLPYESITDLKYLNKVFQETLRKYPSSTNLTRVAVKNFTLPNSMVQIPVGTKVLIPVRGLHHDPQYFPKPEVFDPERFSDEAIQQRPQIVFLPFGEGPRNCIGTRFASYLTKLGIITIIRNYEITLSPGMKVPFDIEKSYPVLSPVGGINVIFEKIPKPVETIKD